jgi:DNA-binding MarR family transcriptional regulator
MSSSSDPRTLVLHGLRLKGFGDASAVAEAVGLTEADAKPILDGLIDEELVTYREGRISGYALTPTGRATHARLLVEQLDATGARPAIQDAYERFLAINKDLLAICTAWQLREVDGESIVNDHSDPAHDAAVVAELGELHDEVAPICADLGAALDRFAGYGPRLAEALSRVRAGDVDWFTKPMLPSYHTVWFELHEDLLATLGIERSSEAVG